MTVQGGDGRLGLLVLILRVETYLLVLLACAALQSQMLSVHVQV